MRDKMDRAKSFFFTAMKTMKTEGCSEEVFEKNFELAKALYCNLISADESLALTNAEYDNVKRYVNSRFTVVMSGQEVIVENKEIKHKPWINKVENHYYWDRYRSYLAEEKHWNDFSLNSLDVSSDKILDMLGNPKSEDNFSRCGLAMGDVQSGKTANYTAVCNKAVDAGYDIIIVLTGILEDLRVQTQDRLDHELSGIASVTFGANIKREHVGVGLNHNDSVSWPVVPITTTDTDFRKFHVDSNGIRLNHLNGTALFVVKKNKSVLESLIEWLKDSREGAVKINKSILLIDDEADNASINTNNPDEKDSTPTAINHCIRQILSLFIKTSYLGITATPFANIFIDPEIKDEELEQDDLFPRDFIYVLDVPKDYIGPNKVFSDDGEYKEHVSFIDTENAEQYIPLKHNKSLQLRGLPQDLCEAMAYFILLNAIRDYRKDLTSHRSMLIHVSRFTDVHEELNQQVSGWLYHIRNDIKSYAKLAVKKADEASDYIKLLHHVFDKFKLEEISGISWAEILSDYLKKAVMDITVVTRNQKSDKRGLDYGNAENGLRVIAIGGNSFARGLTLEGLCVSYFYRKANAYDTLLQMGRWFGYRAGYSDLWRLWTSNEIYHWFREINGSIEELKDDLREMAEHNRKPIDFGIRIRSSVAGLLVTARNKMRTAKEISVSLSKIFIETPRLFLSKVADNERVMQDFVAKLNSIGSRAKEENLKDDLYWHEVSSGCVADLVEKFKCDLWQHNFMGMNLAKHIRKLEQSKWDVYIAQGNGEKYDGFGAVCSPYALLREVSIDDGVIKVSGSKVKVGAGGTAKIGLTPEEKSSIEEKFYKRTGKKNPPDRDYLVENRSPLLVLYVVEIKEDPKTGTGEKMRYTGEYPNNIFALGLGFPGGGDMSSIGRYLLNKVECEKYLEGFEENSEEE